MQIYVSQILSNVYNEQGLFLRHSFGSFGNTRLGNSNDFYVPDITSLDAYDVRL
jgi:hypothetical protein